MLEDRDVTFLQRTGGNLESSRLHVITGASGAGKSTLISALAALGCATVPEAALAVLREQRESGGKALPSADRTAFMTAVLARSVMDYEAALALEAPVFFDRGIPEWLRCLGPDGSRSQVAARYRYATTVFVAESWPEIYVQDDERQASFDRAARSHEATVSAYVQAGYDTCVMTPVSFPRGLCRSVLPSCSKERGWVLTVWSSRVCLRDWLRRRAWMRSRSLPSCVSSWWLLWIVWRALPA